MAAAKRHRGCCGGAGRPARKFLSSCGPEILAICPKDRKPRPHKDRRLSVRGGPTQHSRTTPTCSPEQTRGGVSADTVDGTNWTGGRHAPSPGGHPPAKEELPFPRGSRTVAVAVTVGVLGHGRGASWGDHNAALTVRTACASAGTRARLAVKGRSTPEGSCRAVLSGRATHRLCPRRTGSEARGHRGVLRRMTVRRQGSRRQAHSGSQRHPLGSREGNRQKPVLCWARQISPLTDLAGTSGTFPTASHTSLSRIRGPRATINHTLGPKEALVTEKPNCPQWG